MERSNSAALAATWRDDADRIVGSTWGGTMCWFPRKPGRLRIAREDFSHVVRCGECPGCIEFERRRLADRLIEKYCATARLSPGQGGAAPARTAASSAQSAATLFIVRVYCPLDRQSALAHSLRRRPRLGLEPGFWRQGINSMAMLSSAPEELRAACAARNLRTRAIRIVRPYRRRAWRPLTAGLLVVRERYGAQVKRWYCRGLPPAARESWTVEKITYEKGYRRQTSPRAWRAGRVVLVPPEAWGLGRADRSRLRRVLRQAGSPEAVALVQATVRDLVQRRSLDSSLDVSAKTPSLTVEQVRGYYAEMARRKQARAAGATADLPPPTSEVGGYVSSEHSQGELLPNQAQRAADQRLMERARATAPGSLLDSFARLKARMEAAAGKPLPALDESMAKLRKKLGGEK